MDKTVTFRMDARKVSALDALAKAQERDRTYLLNEAIDNYLDLQAYHRRQIENGLRQIEAGEVVDHADVEKMIDKLLRKNDEAHLGKRRNGTTRRRA